MKIASWFFESVIIEEMVVEWRRENIQSIVFAVWRIAEQEPTKTVEHLSHWLESSDQDTQWIALLCVLDLFDDSRVRKEKWVGEKQKVLLQLLEPVLKTGLDPFIEIIEYVRFWLDCEGWKEKEVDIEDYLLKLAIKADEDGRTILHQAISQTWFIPTQNSSIRVKQLGNQILQTLDLLRGIPTLILPGSAILLGIDGSILKQYPKDFSGKPKV